MKKSEKVALAQHYANIHPEWSNEKIAAAMGGNVSVRTIYRYIGSHQDRLDKIKQTSMFEAQSVLEKANPKITIFDLEVSPVLCATFGIFKQTIQPNQIIRDWSILTWAAKPLYGSRVRSAQVSVEQAKEGKDDGKVLEDLWGILDNSDIMVSFNGKAFDHKKLNTRFILAGLPEPSPYVVLDLLTEVRGKFKFSSNKLSYLCQMFGLGGKLDTNFQLWLDAIGTNGDKAAKKALDYMRKYNKQDVIATEDLMDHLKPYIKHPALSLFIGGDGETCPTCGSTELDPCGYYTTKVARYESLRCRKCKSLCRRKTNALPPEKRKTTLVSI